jgi:hypothetical protein
VKALIDADGLVYKAACSVEETFYGVLDESNTLFDMEWDEAKDLSKEIWSTKHVGFTEEATDKFDSYIKEILDHVGNCEYTLYLSGIAPTFRDRLARIKRYKGNRRDSPRPSHYTAVRDFALKNYVTKESVWMEADDAISLIANRTPDCIVVGNDKDLHQIPGRHYNWQTKESYIVSAVEARVMLWMQVLMGDPVDNVGGCWKIGYGKASKLVKKWMQDDPGLEDINVWVKALQVYKDSQKLKGCPYANDDPLNVLEETYDLVRLLATEEDVKWIIKIMKENTTNGGKRTERSRSSSAEDVQDSDGSIPRQGDTSVHNATVSENSTGHDTLSV